MNPRIREVIETDLCIACGACVVACPPKNIRPAFNARRGAEEVEIVSANACVACAQPCDAVCPSIEVDFARNRRALREATLDSPMPPARDAWIEATYLGWSPTFCDDPVSSSGGVIRELVAQALDTAMPVICLARDPQNPGFKPRLLTTPDQLGDLPGSIYHSTSFVGAIELLRQASAPVLLVAIPCQLSGMLNYITTHEPALAGKIGLICGIVCGWMYSYHALHAFSRFKHISQPELGRTTYRGGDRIGKLTIRHGDAEMAFGRRNFTTLREALDYRSSFSTDYNRLRCRLCEEHLNLGADIIAGDAWLARVGARKVSIIGCRSERGTRAVTALRASGRLRLEPASFGDFIESQSRNLVYGARARKMNRVLGARGQVVPLFRFADANDRVPVGIRDMLSIKLEMLRRSVVRAGYYRLYRVYYFLSRPRMVASFPWRTLKRLVSR